MKAIEKLLSSNKVNGNQSLAARLIGKKQQNIWHWLNSNNPECDIPAYLIPVAAKAIGVRPSKLLPDIDNE